MDELRIVDHEVEAAERPWRASTENRRVAYLRTFVGSGSLLDVGCSSGTFLAAAQTTFRVTGVEPDPGTSVQARARGLEVVAGTLEDVAAPPGGFDAVTLFHVIEHVASPRTLLEQVRGVVKSGGTVLIETPTVDCAWFRLAPRTWRQLIPDHYFFFSEATLGRLLCDCDLVPVACRKVGRRVSLRFLGDRVRRSVAPSRSSPTPILDKLGLADRSLYVNPGDIMSVVARAE